MSCKNVHPEFKSISYRVADQIAHITLNRPHVYNAIDEHMPQELQNAVEMANLDNSVKVGIVINDWLETSIFHHLCTYQC